MRKFAEWFSRMFFKRHSSATQPCRQQAEPPVEAKAPPLEDSVKPKSTDKYYCVFTTLHNPQEHFEGTPEEIAEEVASDFYDPCPKRRACMVAYCTSAKGVDHIHAVMLDTGMVRFSALQKLYPTVHIEPLKGSRKAALDYIQKKGKYAESGEKVLYVARRGEIEDSQGQRNDILKDMELIPTLIEQGLTPEEIMDVRFSLRRYSTQIRDAYNRKRYKETDPLCKKRVFWHVGEPGTGKSYIFVQMCKKFGQENVFFLTDYKNGFDKYCSEQYLILDEFRGQMPFSLFLSVILGEYKCQIPCRYTNNYALWKDVHITSVLPPELVYQNMVQAPLNPLDGSEQALTELDNSEQMRQKLDCFEQLSRRIDTIVYHYKDKDGKRRFRKIPMDKYKGYAALKTMINSAEAGMSGDPSLLTDDFLNDMEKEIGGSKAAEGNADVIPDDDPIWKTKL